MLLSVTILVPISVYILFFCMFAIDMFTICVLHELNRYPHLSEDDFEKNCPVCRNNCNCKACLRGDTTRSKKSMGGDTTRSKKSKKSSPIEVCHFSEFISILSSWPPCVLFVGLLPIFLFEQADEWSVSEEDKIKYSVRAVHFLLPWLKEFHQEQTLERSVEASIEGNMILLPPSRFLA